MKNLYFACFAAALALASCAPDPGKDYSWEKDLQHRLAVDFRRTEPEVREYIERYIPDVTDEQMRAWEATGALECMEIEGQKRYFRNAAPNLFRIDPAARAIKQALEPAPLMDADDSSQCEYIHALCEEVARTGNPVGNPRTMHVVYTLTVNADAVPAGEVIRCWLPFPRTDVPRQQYAKMIGTSPEKYVASPQGVHNTVYMEQKAVKGQPTVFCEEFEYTVSGEYHALSAGNVKPYSVPSEGISEADYAKYTSEQPPHIVFSPRMKALADSLTAGLENPYEQALAIWRWIRKVHPWASAREYSTIPCIPEYVLDSGHGDCGQVSLLFITLCRIKGIPAHFESGFSMDSPKTWNMHDWAVAYFEGAGWVPVDQSYGQTPYDTPQGRDFYMGGIDAFRMIVNEDIGGELVPAKKFPRSETVDFQRGEVEWRGGNLYFPEWDWHLEFEFI